MLCFQEGDQHQRIRRPTVFTTMIERAADELTLQAIVDLEMAFLPILGNDTIRPVGITVPKTRLS